MNFLTFLFFIFIFFFLFFNFIFSFFFFSFYFFFFFFFNFNSFLLFFNFYLFLFFLFLLFFFIFFDFFKTFFKKFLHIFSQLFTVETRCRTIAINSFGLINVPCDEFLKEVYIFAKKITGRAHTPNISSNELAFITKFEQFLKANYTEILGSSVIHKEGFQNT